MKNEIGKEIETILKKNKKINTYIEPFAGGLGAFLNVFPILKKHGINKVILNDYNKKIINLYTEIYKNPTRFFKNYMEIERKFAKTIPHGLHTKDNDFKKKLKTANEFYQEIRERYNHSFGIATTSSQLLFLQNHCFNGIYRENMNGKYNTPFNWNAKIFRKEDLEKKITNIHGIFHLFSIEFSHLSYDDLVYDPHHLYYIDPPYINEDSKQMKGGILKPIHINKKDKKYYASFFDVEEQKKLIHMIKDVSFIYSNHYNLVLLNEFNSHSMDYSLQTIERKNIVSGTQASRRNNKIEILVTHQV